MEALQPSNDNTWPGGDPAGPAWLVAGFPYKQGASSESFAYKLDQAPTLTATRPDASVLIELSGGPVIAAADMRHCTVGAVTQTLTAGGQGISLNVIPHALIGTPLKGKPSYRNDPRQMDMFKGKRRWQVRRLTPRECLALQGFPKDWLDGVMFVPKGRKEARPLSDAQIYKLAGNSWAVPCARNLLQGLVELLEEEELAASSSLDVAA